MTFTFCDSAKKLQYIIPCILARAGYQNLYFFFFFPGADNEQGKRQIFISHNLLIPFGTLR